MHHPDRPSYLFTFEFIGLCAVIFLAYCNTTVFYSLDVYLEWLGVSHSWRGILIGSTALATILSFLAFSARMTTANAARNACIGGVLLILCGVSYVYARSLPALLAVRLAGGAGVYLVVAAAMTYLVACIPPGKSGAAFGIYSTAMLLPYSAVPAVFDAWHGDDMASLPGGYMAMSLFLAPAVAVVLLVGAKMARRMKEEKAPQVMKASEMFRNAARVRMALLLVTNTVNLTAFSSVFFLSKGYFRARELPNVATFFLIQMLCMVGVRLFGSQVFDRIVKMRIVVASFTLTGVACALLMGAKGWPMVCVCAVIMGTGMGLGTPALNSLMYSISEERYRGVNANLMAMAQQMGHFVGPILGTVAVGLLGDSGFLILDMGVCVLGVALCAFYVRRGFDRADPARLG